MVALDVAAGDGMTNDGTVTAAVAAAAAVVANTQPAGPNDEYPPFEIIKGQQESAISLALLLCQTSHKAELVAAI